MAVRNFRVALQAWRNRESGSTTHAFAKPVAPSGLSGWFLVPQRSMHRCALFSDKTSESGCRL